MSFFLSALILGLCLSAMGLGIYITMKIFRIPDITTDGSYTLGAAITAVLLLQDFPLFFIFLIAAAGGAIAGILTGMLHTRMKIDALLAGILVMTGLFSVNLTILGRSNVPLNRGNDIFQLLGISDTQLYNEFWISLFVVILLSGIVAFMLRTDFGIAMRATGSSESMPPALGINVNRMKVIGLAIANALTAISGFLVAQYQGFADINMGIGIVLVGLGSVLIGDAFARLFGAGSVIVHLLFVLIGCIVFQGVLALALSMGINPNLLKLITTLCVVAIVGIPILLKKSRP